MVARCDIFWIGVEPSGQLSSSISNAGVLTTLGAVANNAWHHVALVFNGAAFSLYLDGTRVQTFTNSTAFGTTNPQEVVIGALTASSGTFFTSSAAIDEFALNSTAKYSGTSFTVPTAPLPAAAAGQVALYRFDSNLNDSNVLATATIAAPGSATAGTAFQANFTNPSGGTAYVVQFQNPVGAPVAGLNTGA